MTSETDFDQPRELRFYYNTVFVPEYLSTILISLPISALCMALPAARFRPLLVGNWHVAIALVLYFGLVGWLLFITVRSRVLYHSATFRTRGMTTPEARNVELIVGRRSLSLSELDFAVERRGRLYGRSVRQLSLSDGRENHAEVNDALLNYEAFCTTLAELGCQIRRLDEELPEQAALIAEAWEDRHRVFPVPQTAMDVVLRLGWRIVCLIPVAAIDALISLVTILFLSRLQQQQLMAYSAPLSLAASCMIARYLYFYLFSSTALNRPLV